MFSKTKVINKDRREASNLIINIKGGMEPPICQTDGKKERGVETNRGEGTYHT